jgi:hypothetical protein
MHATGELLVCVCVGRGGGGGVEQVVGVWGQQLGVVDAACCNIKQQP